MKCLEKGRWDSAEWRFYLSSETPSEEKVTAVFGVPIHKEGVILTKNHRGWELPGGHREIGESLKQTLTREILEEAGIRHFESSEKPIGYLEILDDYPKLNKATGENYPNPGYILFYVINVSGLLEPVKEGEALEAKIFPIDNLPEMKNEFIIKHLILKTQSLF